MAIEVVSTPELAGAVAGRLKPPGSISLGPVPELARTATAPCDSTDLLSWMGWMTAGPPSIGTGLLRSAGRWAWIRYRWALEDSGGAVRPSPDTRSIRQHTRSTFSETIGVGMAGYLACRQAFPAGVLAVVDLDDAIEPLLRNGVIRRHSGAGKKQPDYLIARGLLGGPLELLAVECKGTVKNESTAIGQLAAGARQLVGIESKLPLRRIVFATSIDLDGKTPEVRCHAVEVQTAAAAPVRERDLEVARESLLDVALIRSLRCAGHYEAAERVRRGYALDLPELPPTFHVAERPMIGQSVELELDESRLAARVGIDVEILGALAAPSPDRRVRLERASDYIPDRHEDRRRRSDTPDGLHQEILMRDGVGIRLEMRGRRPRDEWVD